MNNKIKVYKTLNYGSNYNELENIDWSRRNNKLEHSKMHSISSYLAMFSPSLPNYFIKKYSKENDTVMDNFSGRGTTGLVARELNRNFIGSDLNPYALVLSRAKIEKYQIEDLIEKLNNLQEEYIKQKDFFYKQTSIKKYSELLYFYKRSTLSQLIFLRDTLGKRWRDNNEYENAILAFSLGLMHGPTKISGETIYFSVDMPNAISMAPNYVKNYVKENNLKKPNVNIFENIKNRSLNKYDEKIISNNFNGKIFEKDSTIENEKINDNSIKLVITSPPYLNIINYTKSNWLKLWLLGYDRSELKNEIKLADNLKLDSYKEFIKSYLNSIYKKIKKNGYVCLVVGDVFGKPLIEDVWKSIKDEVKFKFHEIYIDEGYSQNFKISNMLNSRKGKATLIEKILVLKKI